MKSLFGETPARILALCGLLISLILAFIAVEILLALGFLVVMVVTWPNPPWDALQYGGVGLSILGAVICYPFAKTTWLAVDLIFRPPHREDFITRVK